MFDCNFRRATVNDGFEAVIVKPIFQNCAKKFDIFSPAPGQPGPGIFVHQSRSMAVPMACYYPRAVQGGIPMAVTEADRPASVRGVLI